MKRIILIPLAAIALSGCAGLSIPTGPGAVASQSVIDEKAAITAEIAYTTAARLGTSLVRAGVINPASFGAAESRAYLALLAVRSAYRAGNTPGFDTAIAELNMMIAQVRDLAPE